MHRSVVSQVRLALAGLAMSSVLFSCAHAWRPQDRELAMGQFGYQPMPTREVWCVVDDDMPVDACMGYVAPAIEALNVAANHKLMHFAGLLSGQGAARAHYADGDLIVIAGEMPAMEGGVILGVTMPEVNGFGAIVRVGMALNSHLVSAPGPISVKAVVQHELLHAVGFAHSAMGSSMLCPNYRGVTEYSAYDINSLRAAYGDDR